MRWRNFKNEADLIQQVHKFNTCSGAVQCAQCSEKIMQNLHSSVPVLQCFILIGGKIYIQQNLFLYSRILRVVNVVEWKRL